MAPPPRPSLTPGRRNRIYDMSERHPACLAAGGWHRVQDLAGRHPARQGGYATFREGRVRPEGDLDGLLAVRRRRIILKPTLHCGMGTVVEGNADDPKDQLRLGPPGTVLNIAAADDRRKSANHATLRATRRVAALPVCNTSSSGPNATPRITTAPPPETLKLSASRG